MYIIRVDKNIIRTVYLILFVISSRFSYTQNTINPNSIPDLKVWLRADTGLSLSSLNIVDWTDQSSNHFIFSQLNPSYQPTLVNNSFLNNLPFINFNGQAQVISSSQFTFSNASIFIVATQNSSDGAYGRFIDHDFQNGFWVGRDAGNQAIGGGYFESNAPYGNFEPIINETPFIYSSIKSSDTTYSFLNEIPYTSPYRVTSSISTSSNPIAIGATISGSFFGNKNIYEILIYERNLSTSERENVQRYLHYKYSPPVNLGADITTCTFPITIKAKKDYFKSYLWQDGSVKDSLIVNSSGQYYVNVTDIFGGISSDTIIVKKDTIQRSVILGNDTSFCIGKSITLDAGPSFLSYFWNTGQSTNSITVNNSGLYKVTLTDCKGNVSSDSIQIQVVQLPIFDLGSDSIICYNSNYILDPNFQNSTSLQFNWFDNSHDSIHVVTSAGNYYLTVTNSTGCSFSDTVALQIDSSLNTVSLGHDTTLCAGNYITLTSGLSPSLSYTWSTGSNNSSLLVNTSGQYSVVVTNTNNCVAKDTINVSISGFAPISNFTTNVGCVNSIVSFTDLSIPPSGNTITSYSWNFGDISSGAANTSTLANPSHTYTNTGTYTVSLRVTTNAGCEQTTIKTLTVFPKPTVNFVSGNSCQNDSTAFSSLCTSVAGYSITSLNWNFGDPGSANTSNLTNPKHVFGNQANYIIKLVATNNVGCKDSLINIIAVKAQVKADFTYSTPCTNTATIFQDNSIVPAPNSSNTRTWNFGSLGTSNGLTPSKTYTSSGVYYVTLSVTGINGCSSSITKLITIFSPPIASFSVPTICAKDTFTITNTSLAQSGIISTNDWKINNNHFSSILNPTLSINAAGTYSVKLTTTNSFGCENSTTNTITVNVIPNVDFTTVPSSYYYINSPITLTPNITNASSYLWNISNYAPTSIFSPTVTFTNEGDYTASLFLVDQSGCKNSITKTLSVSKRFLDAAILNVISNKDNDGFMTVQADIANYGSIPVSTLDLNYQVSDGGNIKETWNGMLNPGSFLSYTFSSKTSTQLSSSNNITCVEIKKVNTINDENESNNTLCGSLNSDEISVSNPIPNPTNADITLPVMLNKDIDITISIYNSTGQIQYEDATQKGTTGLNLITLSTSNYSRGCYIIKVNIDDKVFIKKFIKISNQ